ncbi:MAG: enoyl-CoA hydratase [Gammaproteobacteria bacterium]|nr:enoyl-CoA hydratase [Gammaproteobacteria bacterium]
MENLVLIDKADGIATVSLNRPEQLNALSIALRIELAEAFNFLRTDEETRVIVLTGKGRAFSAGLDLKELGKKGLEEEQREEGSPDLLQAIRSVGKPVIAAVNGFAVTGGFELALACDILVASSEASFADTHVRMGVVPGWGLSQRLPRLIGISRAKQLSFTGNYLSAETAERWGLVNFVLQPDELMPYCLAMAKDILSGDHETLEEVHRLIDFGWETSLSEGVAEEKLSSGKVNTGLSAEFLENNRLKVQSRGREQTS